MRRWTTISKGSFALAVALPMLAMYVLSVQCVVGDLLVHCCDGHQEHNMVQYASGHDHAGQVQHSEDHESQKHRGDEDEGCCHDLTTDFFSLFQAQPMKVVAASTLQITFVPSPIQSENPYINPTNQVFGYTGFKPPPQQSPSGAQLRILYESFLN